MPSLRDTLKSAGQSKGLFDGSTSGKLGEVGMILEKYAKSIVADTQKNLKDKNKNASDKLSQSIRFDPIEYNVEKQGYSLRVYMEDYYEAVNDGLLPGKKRPLKPLVDWIFSKVDFKAKIGAARKGLKGVKTKTLGDITAPANVLSAAFGIQKNIQKHGTRPTNFFTDVVNDSLIGNLKKELTEALKKEVIIEIKSLNGSNN